MARRPAQPPAWFGSSHPWRNSPGARRGHPAVRRHVITALVALLVASGVGLLWPGAVQLVSTQGTAAITGPAAGSGLPAPAGAAAESSASADQATATQPSAPAAAEPTISSPSTGELPATAEPAATPAPSGTGAPSPDPIGSAPEQAILEGAPVPSLVAVTDLASSPERRRAQTWEEPPPPSVLDGYVWPLPHGRITDPFGPSPWGSRVVNGELFHDGMDIATFCGDRVVAAHDGIVMAAGRNFDSKIGWVGDLGPYLARLEEKQLTSSLPITIVIDDGNGYRSIYAHFYQVVVKVGQRVKAGQFIGYEGATGRATGCHLHYGLFAPHETATFAIEPSVVKRMLVPPLEIARIDPLLVLPSRAPEPEPSPGSSPASPGGQGD